MAGVSSWLYEFFPQKMMGLLKYLLCFGIEFLHCWCMKNHCYWFKSNTSTLLESIYQFIRNCFKQFSGCCYNMFLESFELPIELVTLSTYAGKCQVGITLITCPLGVSNLSKYCDLSCIFGLKTVCSWIASVDVSFYCWSLGIQRYVDDGYCNICNLWKKLGPKVVIFVWKIKNNFFLIFNINILK